MIRLLNFLGIVPGIVLTDHWGKSEDNYALVDKTGRLFAYSFPLYKIGYIYLEPHGVCASGEKPVGKRVFHDTGPSTYWRKWKRMPRTLW